MKASLQLKHSQTLTMTPQLQQAIKLLQLSRLELQLEIKQMLETNPLLELESDYTEEHESNETPDLAHQELEQEKQFENDDEHWESQNSLSTDNLEQISEASLYEFSPDDIKDDYDADSSQKDSPQSTISDYELGGTSNTSQADDFNFDEINTRQQSLNDLLLEQLNLCKINERDKEIAYLIIESLDKNGYLNLGVDQLTDILNSPQIEELYECDEVLAVLHLVQNFEPSGVAARGLQECLQIQLRQLPDTTPFLSEANELVSRYLHHLESKDFTQIRRKTRFPEETLSAVIRLIQSLNPYPGASINQEETEYIIPDIIVKKHNGQWKAELNEDTLPKVRVNQLYCNLLKRQPNKSDQDYLKSHLQEARWFIKSLHSRHDTLLRVAQEILRIQQDFFELGDEAMKPLVLHDVAEVVGMHESTISRVTTQKYLICPKGIYELKYFFSSHVNNDSGDECSSTAIRAHIKKMISNEDRRKPLSDSKISKLLAEQNIQVARRTIAKYREALSIPPSNERKQLL